MLLSALALSLANFGQTAPQVIIQLPANQPPLAFAAQEIALALKAQKVTAAIGKGTARHTVTIRVEQGRPESFRIENVRDGVNIVGGDLRGAMYGALEVAEEIRIGESRKDGKDRPQQPFQPLQSFQSIHSDGPLQSIRPQQQSPSLPVRMIKFNIPLPGVGYASEESLRKNEWFYDLGYWKRFLAMMARNRYNALSLWSAHPYDRMLRLSKYPEACALTDEELARNQKFFHALFQMAGDHGVDIYLMTWNIHVSPAFAAAHKIAVNGADSPLVRDYTKECVRELLTQYPEITGLGTCPGEAMGRLDADGRMEFIRQTYFEGIREAVEGKRLTVGGSEGSQIAGRGSLNLRSEVRGPRSEADDSKWLTGSGSGVAPSPFANRKSSIVNETACRQPPTANPYPPFILRYWQGTPESTDKMLAKARYPGPVYLDIKYNGEHMYSSTKPHVQNKKWEQMAGKYYQLLWHLRNDDLFTLRWGDPDFARETLGNVGGGRLAVSGSGIRTANREPSTANREPSTANRQPSTTNRQPSTANRQPSTTNRQPSTANRQPSTANRQPSTANRSAGFVMGSEIEIPGEDYIHTLSAGMHKDWKYEFEKQWFKWALWGRLGYNLREPESTWIGHYSARFSKTVGPKVFAAMKAASKILPQVTAFHWNYMNGDWYPEGNVGAWNTSYEVPRQNFRDNRLFHSVDEWVWNNSIDGSLEDIPTYVMRGLSPSPSRRSPSPLKGRVGVGMSGSRDVRLSFKSPRNSTSGSTASRGRPITHPLAPSLKGGGAASPIDVANRLEAWSSALAKLRPNDFFDADHANDREWVCTMQDLQAVSQLGHYYSAKILGATSYCRFLLTGDEASRTNALAHLQKALVHWRKLAAVADAHYIEHEVWLQGQFSWGKYTPDAERDVQIVKNAMPLARKEHRWIKQIFMVDPKRPKVTQALIGLLPRPFTVEYDASRRPEIKQWLSYLNALPSTSELSVPSKPKSLVSQHYSFATDWLFSTPGEVEFRIVPRFGGSDQPAKLGVKAINVNLEGKPVQALTFDPARGYTFEAQVHPGENSFNAVIECQSKPMGVRFETVRLPWGRDHSKLSLESSQVSAPMVRRTRAGQKPHLEIPKGSGRGLDLTANKLLDNGRAEFPVEIKDPGKYVVHAYVNWPDTAGNSFFISFDDHDRDDQATLPPVLGNDDSFENWHWVVSPTFDLKPGKHTLILRNREEGAKVARLVVAKQEGTVSTNNDDGGDLLAAKERNDFFHAIYERMTAVKPLARFKSKAEWQAHAKLLRPNILNALGLWPLPKKVALDPHNSKKLVRDGYTVERVWFQVFPKVYASAYLYIPDAAKQPGAKLPAILHPHGHWDQGAADPVVQSRCIALAKMGYVGLCPDSTHVFDFPTGLCPVGQMTWDNIRGLDYLESLPYVDKSKIGCTGASGGGQQTMYLGAVDDRISVLVPAVMVCYFKRILFESEDAHHFCNHVPGIAALADQTEMAAMFAPRPTLFICATGDWTLTVPKEEFPDMKHIWDLTGGDTAVVQFDKPHNFDQDSREQMYAWFNKYLKNDSDPAHAKEPPLKIEDPNTLRALSGPPSGAAGHEGAVAYYRKTFGFKEPVLKSAVELESWRQDVLFGEWNNFQSLSLVFGLHMGYQGQSRRVGEFEIAGLKAEKWLMWTHSDDHIPCWYFPPKGRKKNGPGVVIAYPQGKRALLAERQWLVRSLLEKGIGVMAIDVHYRGEIKRDWRWNSMIWGSSEAGTAAEDMLCVRFDMNALPELGHGKVYIVGLGDLGVAALIANAIDSYGVGAAVDDIGLTYIAGREAPDIPGLLRYADLPQIAALAAPRKLWINGAREPFWFTRKAYTIAKAEKNLWITTKHDAEFDYGLAGWVLGK